MSEPPSPPTPEIAPTSTLDWAELLSTHERWLKRLVVARLNEPQGVEEVMQEVALAAMAQRSPIFDPASVVGWLYRLAVRHVLIYRRKEGRRRALVGRYAAKRATKEETAEPSPLGWLLHDERRLIVRRALSLLPPRDADLLVLKYAEGWSARELAEKLNLRVSTIETRLHRARGRLRLELAALADEYRSNTRDIPNDA
jgi:RNA polymerase sigma-70 factor, ECF subfamily